MAAWRLRCVSHAHDDCHCGVRSPPTGLIFSVSDGHIIIILQYGRSWTLKKENKLKVYLMARFADLEPLEQENVESIYCFWFEHFLSYYLLEREMQTDAGTRALAAAAWWLCPLILNMVASSSNSKKWPFRFPHVWRVAIVSQVAISRQTDCRQTDRQAEEDKQPQNKLNIYNI